MSDTTKEIHEGTNGSGNRTFLVVTIAGKNSTRRQRPVPAGKWLHVEHFDNRAEAMNWIKWC